MKAQIQMFPLVQWEQPNRLFDNYFNQCKLLEEHNTQGSGMEIGYLAHDVFSTNAPDGEYDLYSSLEVWSDIKITVKDNAIIGANEAIFSILEKRTSEAMDQTQLAEVSAIEFEADKGWFYVYFDNS